jgi:hypothetical protein
MRLTYCLPNSLYDESLSDFPGMRRFRHFFSLYGIWALPVDRTGVMKTPVRDAARFPVPSLRPMKKSFEQLCNERAVQVLSDAERLGVRMYVLYSGGIDSSCLLVSLLKHATAEQKKNMTVLLTNESIAENPRLYEEHIRGKLAIASSFGYADLIGTDCYILSAEHNDMVMGSEKIGKLLNAFGAQHLNAAYDRDLMNKFYGAMLGNDAELTDFYLDLYQRIADAAPIPIETNLEFLWWINFAFKWQACYYYMLLFTSQKNAPLVTQEYLDSRFISFYNTEEFQLWSMHNTDKRIKDTWKSYKYVCKDIIYDFTKDAEYRDHKIKRGSLGLLVMQQTSFSSIDEHVHFSQKVPGRDNLLEHNDFA